MIKFGGKQGEKKTKPPRKKKSFVSLFVSVTDTFRKAVTYPSVAAGLSMLELISKIIVLLFLLSVMYDEFFSSWFFFFFNILHPSCINSQHR